MENISTHPEQVKLAEDQLLKEKGSPVETMAKKVEGLKGKNNPAYKHGYALRGKLPSIYTTYHGMISRCHRVEHPRYSGRGISVCDRWRFGEDGKTGFECYISDMGMPFKGGKMDRINNDLGYSPENCRWVTHKENCNNRSNCVKIEFDGKVQSMEEWSNQTGIPYQTIRDRLKRYNWSIENTLTTPVKKKITP